MESEVMNKPPDVWIEEVGAALRLMIRKQPTVTAQDRERLDQLSEAHSEVTDLSCERSGFGRLLSMSIAEFETRQERAFYESRALFGFPDFCRDGLD